MKLKGIVLAVILSLASIMMPFTVYADSITTANINGISVVLDEVTYIETISYQTSSGTINTTRNIFVYNAEIQLDKSYLGYINITLDYKYNAYYGPSSGYVLTNGTKVQKVFVNGDKAYLSFSFITNNTTDPLVYSNITYTLNSSDLIEYGLISDIQTIIDILQENQDIITDIYSELQTVVSNTSLANQYLETISELRQYSFPIESFSAVLMAYNFNTNIIDLFQNGYWTYPVFSIPSGNTVIQRYFKPNYNNLVFIFGCNFVPNTNQIGNYFNIENANIVSLTTVKEAIGFRVGKLILSYTGDSTGYITITALRNIKIIPIYLELTDYNMISTDFALQYGLNNDLLQNIQIIANGTTQSNSAASDLESSNDQMADDMDDLATIESGYNQQFNNQLQQIDFSSPLQNNAGILPAANFVITIFNGLINNNPFSVLIIIVCILLIGKKVIGK